MRIHYVYGLFCFSRLERNRMANRKDSKGRVLKAGESQRKDLTYEYKYKDRDGKRKSIYAKDLKTLREKEKEIQKMLERGVSSDASKVLFGDLVDQYASLQHYENEGSLKTFTNSVKRIKPYNISKEKISNITKADAKAFLIEMNVTYSDSIVKKAYAICKNAFEYAIDKELVTKNPFNFPLTSVLRGKKKEVTAFTEDEFNSLIGDMKESEFYSYYVPHFIFLKETGLRISEFLGLTLRDVDLENKVISVNQQIQRSQTDRTIYFCGLKTKSSKAKIPLSSLAEEALRQLIANCKTPTTLKDKSGKRSRSGFFIVTKNGLVSPAKEWRQIFKRIENWYNQNHPESPIEIHPHKFRHTTATALLRKGLSVTSTQKMLRHSNPDVTLRVYTHLSEEDLNNEFRSIIE